MAERLSDVNTVGNGEYVGTTMGSADGGNTGRGPLDNVLPTGVVARGNEMPQGGGFDKGIRKEMSAVRGNRSIAKRGESRRP